jgi:hypothetical protein
MKHEEMTKGSNQNDDVAHCSICDDLLTIPVPKTDRKSGEMWFCGQCAFTKRWLEKNLNELGQVAEENLMDWMKKHPDMSLRLKRVLKFVLDTKRW